MDRVGRFSVNALICCDANFIITHINALYPGSAHDFRIYDESCFKKEYEADGLIYDGFLLGDQGFPCRGKIITQFPEPQEGLKRDRDSDSKLEFSRVLRQCRSKVEETIGKIKNKFQLLKQTRKLTHEQININIHAAAVLYNLSVKFSWYYQEVPDELVKEYEDFLRDNNIQHHEDANDMREELRRKLC